MMPAEKDGDHSNDALSNEEMAAFDKIMGEIEDQEVKKLSGSSNGPETEDSGEQTLPEGAASTAENRLDASDNEKGREDDDGLDADQQKAFESIMTQIEGGGSGDDVMPARKRRRKTSRRLKQRTIFPPSWKRWFRRPMKRRMIRPPSRKRAMTVLTRTSKKPLRAS